MSENSWRDSGSAVPKWTTKRTPPKILLETTEECVGCRERFFFDSLFVSDTLNGEQCFCSLDCYSKFTKK